MTPFLNWTLTNVFSLAAFIISVISLRVALKKERRKVAVRLKWSWRTPTGAEPTPTKQIRFYVVNMRSRTVKILGIMFEYEMQWYEGKPPGYSSDQVIVESKVLTDGESFHSFYEITDFANILSVYAVESTGKKWHAPAWQLELIRGRKSPTFGRGEKMQLAYRFWKKRRELGIPSRALD